MDGRNLSTKSFNPRAPRGARRRMPEGLGRIRCFNPRAPRGARRTPTKRGTSFNMFQSTRPARGATRQSAQGGGRGMVSIHAPRAGRDGPAIWLASRCASFNPRAPRGARLRQGSTVAHYGWFQSTRPARGATQHARPWAHGGHVSIHAPRAGRDALRRRSYPAERVSIHAPRAGRDGVGNRRDALRRRFNPRAPRGARRQSAGATPMAWWFQSTRPARGATVEDLQAALAA